MPKPIFPPKLKFREVRWPRRGKASPRKGSAGAHVLTDMDKMSLEDKMTEKQVAARNLRTLPQLGRRCAACIHIWCPACLGGARECFTSSCCKVRKHYISRVGDWTVGSSTWSKEAHAWWWGCGGSCGCHRRRFRGNGGDLHHPQKGRRVWRGCRRAGVG